jgi:hypothetical protein
LLLKMWHSDSENPGLNPKLFGHADPTDAYCITKQIKIYARKSLLNYKTKLYETNRIALLVIFLIITAFALEVL